MSVVTLFVATRCCDIWLDGFVYYHAYLYLGPLLNQRVVLVTGERLCPCWDGTVYRATLNLIHFSRLLTELKRGL
jgi:hypothetical protein